MTKPVGINITLHDNTGIFEKIQLPAFDGTNGGLISGDVNDFFTDNYANSSAWIIPNVMHAIISNRSIELVIPLQSYNGLTGETELLRLDVVKA